MPTSCLPQRLWAAAGYREPPQTPKTIETDADGHEKLGICLWAVVVTRRDRRRRSGRVRDFVQKLRRAYVAHLLPHYVLRGFSRL
jgi:hypothetical protein